MISFSPVSSNSGSPYSAHLKHEKEPVPGHMTAESSPATKQLDTTTSQHVHTSSSSAGADHDAEGEREETVNGLTAEEQKVVQKLKARDREVRAHEQAHAAVGGAHAGAPSFSYQRGPDGQSYAIGGEVSIDVSAVPNDPEATIRKMQLVRRAALAPAQPSGADRRIAQQASAKEAQARAELLQQQREEASAEDAEKAESSNSSGSVSQTATAESPSQPPAVDKVNQAYTDLLSPSEPVIDVDV